MKIIQNFLFYQAKQSNENHLIFKRERERERERELVALEAHLIQNMTTVIYVRVRGVGILLVFSFLSLFSLQFSPSLSL